MLVVRKSVAADADALGLVMYDAIRSGPSRYTEAQRIAWLDRPPAGGNWAVRLSTQQVWMAEAQGEPLGFLTLDETGYIDLAFVTAAAQGKGVFSALYDALEAAAMEDGLTRLWTHASLMAQPVFEARGFRVIRHETIDRKGETLARAEMEKSLT
ncbi:GNAT family N-acetyltransferase [Tateyamaria pelophila]|uniref:GNAT family N-acetyltransferase n=1 Tax=Tateyamaria pelophila TaxID=328415 RepID=UPI001CBAB5EA|nr:GNAT family N-acetyltransferase [Tateyamaria pelophila]